MGRWFCWRSALSIWTGRGSRKCWRSEIESLLARGTAAGSLGAGELQFRRSAPSGSHQGKSRYVATPLPLGAVDEANPALSFCGTGVPRSRQHSWRHSATPSKTSHPGKNEAARSTSTRKNPKTGELLNRAAYYCRDAEGLPATDRPVKTFRKSFFRNFPAPRMGHAAVTFPLGRFTNAPLGTDPHAAPQERQAPRREPR